MRRVLRSTSWDGSDPAVGDVVRFEDGSLAVVSDVARGPGVGQFRLVVCEATVIDWRDQRSEPRRTVTAGMFSPSAG